MSQYFSKPYKSQEEILGKIRIYEENINVKVDLSSYATKPDLKNVTHHDTSSFALTTNLASLKTEVDKLDVDKLVSVPVNNIDTSGFALKTKYDVDKSELEKKIPDTSELVKKTNYNNKITEIENKIPSVSGLAKNAALAAVENKIPNIDSLVKKKTEYKTNFTKIENKLTDHNQGKYITTPEFNRLTAENFAARLKQANLITKTDFDDKL